MTTRNPIMPLPFQSCKAKLGSYRQNLPQAAKSLSRMEDGNKMEEEAEPPIQ